MWNEPKHNVQHPPSPGHSRDHALHVIRSTVFDVAVIGAGINGAAIACAAARSGLATVLLDKRDFASGTSSRSSRLIHGGVRYLEHGLIGLVFESTRERRLLGRIAPHLVQPLAFTWPVYEGARIPRWKLSAGLFAYDALSLFRQFRSHEGLSATEVTQAEPALASAGLRGGARYYDARTNDARLTLANVVAAQEAGATVLNYCELRAITDHGEAAALQIINTRDGSEHAVRAKIVVNATGPWSDSIARHVDPSHTRLVHGSKGSHISVPRDRVRNAAALTLLAPSDERVFFVLPAGTTTIIGTTELETDESPDEVRASESEIAYLLEATNHFFPDAQLARQDVIAAWSGIRPLAAEHFSSDGASASREHELSWIGNRMLAVHGGKLTTYRVVARDALEQLLARFPDVPQSRNGHLDALPGGDIASLANEVAQATAAAGSQDIGEHLVSAYGSRWRRVWDYVIATPALAHRLHPTLPYTGAEVAYAVQHEFACSIADVLLRRTHAAFELPGNARGIARQTGALMQAALGWLDAQLELELLEYERELGRIFGS